MAFPTIPTVASGRVLTGVQANTTQVRTFPNLSGLTKNAGDRLIAIVIGYQSSIVTDSFFTWGGGFTEIANRATSTTMNIGIAEKISDGTETGTFTVTQSGTVTGHACFILLSISGAHASTPSEVSAKADGTTTAALVPGFDPNGWDVEDTLWIFVGASGEISTTGSYTGITSSNGSNFAATAASGDVAGAVQGAVSFNQAAIPAVVFSSWNFAVDLSNARNSSLAIAVRPASNTVPVAIGNLSGTAGNQQVALTWSAPDNGGAAITDYSVEYLPSGGSWTAFSDGVSTATTATVTGLTNGVSYTFRVAAVNSIGTAAWSNIAGGYTPLYPPTTITPVRSKSTTKSYTAQLTVSTPLTTVTPVGSKSTTKSATAQLTVTEQPTTVTPVGSKSVTKSATAQLTSDMNKLYLGDTKPTKLYLADTLINRVYLGDVRVFDSGTFPTVALRVNAAGSQLTDTPLNWVVDTAYISNGEQFSTAASIDMTHPSVVGFPMALFQTDRYGSDLTYTFPVDNGGYRIDIALGEIYTPFAIGNRVFSIIIDGTTVLSNYDTIADVGMEKAVVKSFNVTVSTGQILVRFLASVNNANPSGFQIVRTS